MSNLRAIAKDSPIPVFYQIYVDIKKRILAHTIQDEEQKLPSERDLAEEYGVSRVTMRQSLAELEKDGIIIRERGRGSFVNETPRPILQQLKLPSDKIMQSARSFVDPHPEIVQLTRFEQTDPEIGENLNYDGPIFYIKRIFRVNGNPIAVNRIWLPEKFTPQLDIVGLCVDNSLSKTLSQHYGIKILHRTNIVEAVRPSSTEVDLLKITYDTLILQISSTSFTENNVPYEFSRTSWIGDAIRLKVDVTDIEHSLEIAT